MSAQLFYIIVWGWIAIAVIAFFALQFITAPFGRHTRNDFGPTINARLAWCLMELPSPLVFSFFFLMGSNSPTTAMWVFFGLWNLHYLNRSLIYPFRQKDTKKRMPVAIMWSAIGFNLMNGFINGYYLGNFAPVEIYDAAWLTDPRFIVGLIIFFVGMGINIQSDNVLLALRKPGETGYKIPKGSLFRYVSCPNLFGEMLEWTGFAILIWSLPALAFAIWTVANLLPRAIDHHKWYLDKFGDEYPKERRAVFPFLL
jgi:3-oxo-5-alpha-steroid 4-dehydrogenase 1